MNVEIPDLVFLGVGQVAEAIIRGVISTKLVPPGRITGSHRRPERREQLLEELGIGVAADNQTAAGRGELIFVCVKPADVPGVLREIAPVLNRDQVVVSVAAGITIAQLEALLDDRRPVVRVMPNAPCLAGQGMSAIAAGSYATAHDEALVERIFQAVGRAVRLPEKYLDAVTALSASGPAFVAVVVEALADAGVRVGLPRQIAQTLAAQTVLGTGHFLLATGSHPAELKDMVASPGGTTIAGLHELERAGVRAIFMDAVLAAANRARELAAVSDQPSAVSQQRHGRD